MSHFIECPPNFGLVLPNPRTKSKREGEVQIPWPVVDFKDLAKRHNWNVQVDQAAEGGLQGAAAEAVEPTDEKMPKVRTKRRTGRTSARRGSVESENLRSGRTSFSESGTENGAAHTELEAKSAAQGEGV